MRTLIIDIMLGGRFVATLRYRYCLLFPIVEKELHNLVVSELPTLTLLTRHAVKGRGTKIHTYSYTISDLYNNLYKSGYKTKCHTTMLDTTSS